jgi:hypothetical protein
LLPTHSGPSKGCWHPVAVAWFTRPRAMSARDSRLHQLAAAVLYSEPGTRSREERMLVPRCRTTRRTYAHRACQNRKRFGRRIVAHFLAGCKCCDGTSSVWFLQTSTRRMKRRLAARRRDCCSRPLALELSVLHRLVDARPRLSVRRCFGDPRFDVSPAGPLAYERIAPRRSSRSCAGHTRRVGRARASLKESPCRQ